MKPTGGPVPWIEAVRAHLEVDGALPRGTFPRLAEETGIGKRQLVSVLIEGWRPRREMDFVLKLAAALHLDPTALMQGKRVEVTDAVGAATRMTGDRSFRPVLECAADAKLRAQLVKAARAILAKRRRK